MYTACLLLSVLPMQVGQAPHEKTNPLFRELRETGLAIDAKNRVTFPAPSMPDGLDAQGQLAVIKKVAGAGFSVDELLRRSPVTPQILRIHDLQPSDPKAPTRGVDVWFVAYGDLEAFTDRDFQERVFNPGEGEEGRPLTEAELKKRDITLIDKEREEYGRAVFLFLDRVELSVTGRSFLSQTDESILIASQIDPRFTNDPEFANQWRSVKKMAQRLDRGPAHPYDTGAFYVKITRLIEPKGALFIEAHVIFTEPHGWFDGANLLRSRLPPVVQNDVRNLRRELLKVSGK